jgi:multimeric flavodoxin WrbA
VKVIGIQSGPNEDGLTSNLAKAVLRGAEAAGAEVEMVHLNKLEIVSCTAGGKGGWGMCRREGRCAKKDDFQGLRDKINAADALVFSTPVYFGGLSESAKCFLDRWRRCEVKDREGSPLRGKRAIGISAAGDSGGGAVKALRDLEEYLRWLQLTIFDLEPVTRRNADYKLRMLETAGRNLAGEERRA